MQGCGGPVVDNNSQLAYRALVESFYQVAGEGVIVAQLSELLPGQRGRIARVEGAGAVRRRLLDLGLVCGTEIRVLRAAPFRDPLAFWVRGYQIAMRRRDAAAISVEVL
ncbi:MAG: ferrous iron transport protein A [Cyanobacteria bacterium REEB65]|nr:ferrous iron transport protein A [Cyanobacteria bacterium REEB65]